MYESCEYMKDLHYNAIENTFIEKKVEGAL